jgi:hypothetical protein
VRQMFETEIFWCMTVRCTQSHTKCARNASHGVRKIAWLIFREWPKIISGLQIPEQRRLDEDGSSPFSAKNSLCFPCGQASEMFRAGLRSTWNAFSRPAPTSPWQTFFRTNQQKRTLINASRDNHWPRSPLLPEGKGFNWDAFRWTNYRVASTFVLGFGLM